MAALPETWFNAELGEPRFRWTGRALVVQRAPIERFWVLFIGAWAVACVGAGIANGEALWAVGGLVIGAICVAGWVAVLRIRPVLDEAGWHIRNRTIRWADLEEILIFRGSNPMQDFLRARGGERFGFLGILPDPLTRRSGVGRRTIDLLCHLQHDVAHELGVAPVPVVVDMGHKVPRVGFVHPCPSCDRR